MVDVHEAKARFSALLERVAAGEEIVIAKAGRPVARLVPYASTGEARSPGGWQGRVHLAADFDDLPPELAPAFAGEC